jgi:hypothetical protein
LPQKTTTVQTVRVLVQRCTRSTALHEYSYRLKSRSHAHGSVSQTVRAYVRYVALVGWTTGCAQVRTCTEARQPVVALPSVCK